MEEKVNAPTVRSVGVRYGLIFAVIGIAYFLIFTMADLDMSQGIGRWGTTLISIVIVFLAHKYFKDNGDTFMTYGQGVGIGFWLALVSSVVSSIFTYIYMKFIDTGYVDMIRQKSIEQMEAKGSSDQEIEMAMKYVEMFTTPEMILVFGLFFGILMLVIVALIVSIFTQKKSQERTF